MPSQIPETIGKYKVLDEIDRDGPGRRYRARDQRNGRDVAIELLDERLDHDMRERFAREARSAGRLAHVNIATIFEVGEHNGVPFIVMEHVPGETLASFISRRPSVPLLHKLQIMDEVCAGLHYAHLQGLIHRDIRPATIVIDHEGTAKIADFGISRLGTSITQTGNLLGTINYTAPELLNGQGDARVDQFSWGAVFYELLSYRPAFPGESPASVIRRILYDNPESLGNLRPELDPRLVAMVTRCLEKEPANRYPDLSAVRRELVTLRDSLHIQADTQVVSRSMPSETTSVDNRRTRDILVRAERTRVTQIQSHIDAAHKALEQGNYDLALEACERALVLDPSSSEVLQIEALVRAEIDQTRNQIVERSDPSPSPPPFTEVTVFYGTDRARASPLEAYGPDRGFMRYGTSLVTVPTSRKIGSIPRPTIWTLFREKPEKHFILTDVVDTTKADFVSALRARVGSSQGKQALVFVHGFNVEFRDAIYRTAQIAADLQFDGAPVLFSWPSRGVLTPLGYTYDEEQARWALPDLREFLELIVQQSGAQIIHLLAHSMGNRVMTEALLRLGSVLKHSPAIFNEVVLTAPDIDADTFVRDIASAILPTSRRITLYASSADRALAFSKTVHGYRRAGDSGEDITLFDGIDTIDVSSVDTNFVGHFYYGENRSVLSDIFNLIQGHHVATRFGLLPRHRGNRKYWIFQP